MTLQALIFKNETLKSLLESIQWSPKMCGMEEMRHCFCLCWAGYGASDREGLMQKPL